MITLIEHQFDNNTGHPTEVTWEFQMHCEDLSDLRPTHINSDGSISKSYPQVCKVRDLNYEVELNVDITFRKVVTLKIPNAPKEVVEENEP